MINLLTQFRNWAFRSFPAHDEAGIIQGYLNRPFGLRSISGVPVTPESTLSIAAVWSGINCIANPIAAMKLPIYKRTKSGKTEDPKNSIYDLLGYRANPVTTSLKFRQTLMFHALLYGNGYAEIVRDKATGDVLELWNLTPGTVTVQRVSKRKFIYLVEGRRVLQENIIHISQIGFEGIVGYAMHDIGRETIGLTKATELYGAGFFGNGASPGGFITTDKNMKPNDRINFEAELNRESQGVENAHKLKVLQPGMSWNVSSVPPEAAQFLATRKFQREEIALLLNIDPARIGAAPKPTDIESYNRSFWNETLWPWVELIENEINTKLFSDVDRRTWFAEHDFSSMLRGNDVARADYHTKMYSLGAITTNQIIIRENLGDTIGPAGDLHFIPNNNLTSLEQIHQDLTNPKPDPEPVPVEPEAAPIAETKSNDVALNAVRGLVQESIQRMIRREAEAIRRASNKDKSDYREAAEAFYVKHKGIIRDSIGSSVRAFVAVSGVTENADELIEQIASELVTSSQEQLIEQFKDREPEARSGDELEQLLADWETNKARTICEQL